MQRKNITNKDRIKRVQQRPLTLDDRNCFAINLGLASRYNKPTRKQHQLGENTRFTAFFCSPESCFFFRVHIYLHTRVRFFRFLVASILLKSYFRIPNSLSRTIPNRTSELSCVIKLYAIHHVLAQSRTRIKFQLFYAFFARFVLRFGFYLLVFFY